MFSSGSIIFLVMVSGAGLFMILRDGGFGQDRRRARGGSGDPGGLFDSGGDGDGGSD